jgi:pyruvate formate lyase activating enzyme
MAGERLTADKVVDIVLADKVFYDYSHGGVTLSGGDPLLQLDFSKEVLFKCKENKIHTAFESALNFSWSHIEKILPVTDLIMADIKHIDSLSHMKGTGVKNERILDNLKKLSERGFPMILRTPVIPGFNDSEEVMEGIFSFVKELESVKYFELLEFHRLGEYKYSSLGQEIATKNLMSVPKEKMRKFASLADKSGIKIKMLS